MRGLVRSVLGIAVLLVSACAPGTRSRPAGDPDLIMRHEVLAGSYSTAHDVVRALHPNWLIKRNPNGNNSPTPIWVYVDGNKYGDVNWLRNVSAQTIGSIRRIDGISATTRWGTGYTEGVLYILTYVPGSSAATEN